MEERRNKLIFLENTRFIFRTNFAGLPDEKYGSTTRYGNILIPDPEIAQELVDDGYLVKETKPREGEEAGFEPKYFTRIVLNYNSDYAKNNPPKVYLVEGNKRTLLDEDSVGMIDHIYILNVKVSIEESFLKKFGKKVLYIKTMYIYHDTEDDPWAAEYEDAGQPEED